MNHEFAKYLEFENSILFFKIFIKIVWIFFSKFKFHLWFLENIDRIWV